MSKRSSKVQKGQGFLGNMMSKTGNMFSGIKSTVTSVGKTCSEIYREKGSFVSNAYNLLESANDGYKKKNNDNDHDVFIKLTKTFNAITKVGKSDDKDCLASLKQEGVSIPIGVSSYSAFIDSFIREANEATILINNATAGVESAKTGMFSGITSLAEKCGDTYSKHATAIEKLKAALETQSQKYKSNVGVTHPIVQKPLDLYEIIKAVGTEYANDRNCKGRANDLGAKRLKSGLVTSGFPSYNAMIDAFYKEAQNALFVLNRDMANIGKNGDDLNKEVRMLLTKLNELQNDLMNTTGLTKDKFGFTDFARYGVIFLGSMMKAKKQTTGDPMQTMLEDMTSGNKFKSSDYDLMINVLSKLYLSISRKRFVLSHPYSYYYQQKQTNASLSNTQKHSNTKVGGRIKSIALKGGDLDSIFQEDDLKFCGKQNSISEKISTKINDILMILKKSSSMMDFITKFNGGKAKEIKENKKLEGFEKIGMFYLLNDESYNNILKLKMFAPSPVIVLATNRNVYIYDHESTSYRLYGNNGNNAEQFVKELKETMNSVLDNLVDQKDKNELTLKTSVNSDKDVMNIFNEQYKAEYGQPQNQQITELVFTHYKLFTEITKYFIEKNLFKKLQDLKRISVSDQVKTNIETILQNATPIYDVISKLQNDNSKIQSDINDLNKNDDDNGENWMVKQKEYESNEIKSKILAETKKYDEKVHKLINIMHENGILYRAMDETQRVMNKEARLKILGLIADFIDFFEFKKKCSSKMSGGGSRTTVTMYDANKTMYNVPKNQVEYFKSLGFVDNIEYVSQNGGLFACSNYWECSRSVLQWILCIQLTSYIADNCLPCPN